jgi:cytochrome c-type biogenesis protein
VGVSVALAFAAGLVSFVSPCVLALVPVYIAFLGERAGEGPASRPLIVPAALFVLGFSGVFVVLGTPVGLLGQGAYQIEPVRRAAGLLIVLLGLLTTGIFGPVLERWSPAFLSSASGAAATLPPERSLSALALGGLVSVGWIPCIGPVLGTILTMSMSASNTPAVVLLLAAYCAGLAVPFMAAALALPRLRPVMDVLGRHHRSIQVLAGAFIMAMGLLIFANAFARMSSLFSFFL